MWSRIDALNSNVIKRKRLAPQAAVAKLLSEAQSILRDPEFYNLYQKIRVWASENNFSQANQLRKRAAPILDIAFDGDTERYAINYEFVRSLVSKNTEPGEFFTVYPELAAAIAMFNQSADETCYVPFNLRPCDLLIDPAKVLVKWQRFAATWKDPFFRERAEKAVECLTKR